MDGWMHEPNGSKWILIVIFIQIRRVLLYRLSDVCVGSGSDQHCVVNGWMNRWTDNLVLNDYTHHGWLADLPSSYYS